MLGNKFSTSYQARVVYQHGKHTNNILSHKEENRQLNGKGGWLEGGWGEGGDMGECNYIIYGPWFCLNFFNVHALPCLFTTLTHVQLAKLSLDYIRITHSSDFAWSGQMFRVHLHLDEAIGYL